MSARGAQASQEELTRAGGVHALHSLLDFLFGEGLSELGRQLQAKHDGSLSDSN